MKAINKLLTENKAGIKSLPKELQEDIKDFKNAIVEFNKAADEVEEDDEETNKELDEKEVEINNWEKALVAKLKEHFQPKKEEPAPAPAPAPAPETTPAPTPTLKEEKKDNSVGWLIFAGVVFAATLGAVNMMKKRA